MRGIKRFTDRHGKTRLYHRKSGTPIDPALSDAEIAARVAELDRRFADKTPRPGTLGGLFDSYRRSPRFTRLAPRTKADYERIWHALHKLHERDLLDFTPGFCARLRDVTLARKKAGFTNHMMAMLSSVFRHGVEYEIVERNPVAGLSKAPMPRERRRPNRPWQAQEIRNALDLAPPHLLRPLALAAYLGLRRGDITALPRNAYDGRMLRFRASKTGRTMALPVVGRLKQILDAEIENQSMCLCPTSHGDKWTDGGLSASMRKFFARLVEMGAAQPGITLHGLKHSVARALREAGYSNAEIAPFTAHDDERTTAHYSSTADLNPMLTEMAHVIERGTNGEQKVSNLGTKTVKPRSRKSLIG
ncbi:MAG: tyrosine-type recombinase/integrase [Hyphomicrobiaceae bacterium]|nr:tyrosine-type recombinase/integrase [Hyphomicrobiaceae bacterium]MCC0024593.1 tyrosine-type recombinase/integrase [Hyphomicrobiaceae bacterium]